MTRPDASQKPIFIIDAVGFLFRSYYAIRNMSSSSGTPTNATYGFIRSILKLIKEFSPTSLVAVFDGPNNKKSRTEIYADYKSNREGMPDDLVIQLEHALEFCRVYGIPLLQVPGVEADDTMGAVATWAKKQGFTSYLCSSDKDLCQLVDDATFILNTHKDNLVIDSGKVQDKHGVLPSQFIDLLAIMGDTSDNIPGIPGFGPKTAAKLLGEFGSLQNLLANAEKLPSAKKRQTVEENKDLALISQQLATIDTTISIPTEESFYKLPPPPKEKLKEFYSQLDFFTLVKELGEETTKSPPTKTDYTLIETKQELDKLISDYLPRFNSICIDTETTSTQALSAKLVGIGLCAEKEKAYYIPLNHSIERQTIIDSLNHFISSHPKVGFFGHNIKYDLHVLNSHKIKIENVSFDTMIASHLANADANRHNLDQLALEYFGKVKIAYKDLVGSGKKQITLEEVDVNLVKDYCCEDVDYTFRLKEVLAEKLKKLDLERLFFEIELPLLHVLQAVEENGIFLNLEKLHTLKNDVHERLKKLEKDITSLAGESFNLNSPKQLSEILFEKLAIPPVGKKKTTGYSTSASSLELLRHDYLICDKILEYRMFEKLRSTYIETLPEQVNPKTQRIHCTFNQSVTATGRLACQDPNLQNIPVRSKEGKKVREAFEPQEKTSSSFLSADYSQIELRILAHLSQDDALLSAFSNGEDIHTFTAACVYDLKQKDVTSHMRSIAKAVNFGLIYGQQAFGLSKQLGISMKEAASFIDTYFKRYPKVKTYIDETIAQAKESKVAVTFTGRRRPLNDIDSKNPTLRALSERLAINTPIQGSQADIIKMAMIKIQTLLEKNPHLGKMILQIHDELIFEVPDAHKENLKKHVVEIMENVIPLSVPLTVDVSFGKNWGEC